LRITWYLSCPLFHVYVGCLVRLRTSEGATRCSEAWICKPCSGTCVWWSPEDRIQLWVFHLTFFFQTKKYFPLLFIEINQKRTYNDCSMHRLHSFRHNIPLDFVCFWVLTFNVNPISLHVQKEKKSRKLKLKANCACASLIRKWLLILRFH